MTDANRHSRTSTIIVDDDCRLSYKTRHRRTVELWTPPPQRHVQLATPGRCQFEVTYVHRLRIMHSFSGDKLSPRPHA